VTLVALYAWSVCPSPVTFAQQAGAELHVMPIRGNVFMIVGGGSNVTYRGRRWHVAG
jgi:hypothetical protein